ncbi:MAG: hypothetical protein ACRDXB_03720, partial [Actinomycetes bacterium]
PMVLDSYGLASDLGLDGSITVEVIGEETLPLLVRDLPWAASGAICYHVRWDPPDLYEANQEFPQPAHVVARRRAADLVAKMAVAIQVAVGGEIADEADFLLAPEDL